jgi:hypothetical protein
MEFIQELHEARLTRNDQNLRVLTYTDCCERLYLSLLILEILRKFPVSSRSAKQYAQNTGKYAGFNMFRMSGTDLYNFIYFVNGDEKALNKLKDPGAAAQMRRRTTLPTMVVNRYLAKLANGSNITDSAQMLINVENSLSISNQEYKQVRRNITNLSNLSTSVVKKTVTRLVIAARAKLRTSDIIDDLEKLTVLKDLETSSVIDTEPTVSVADIPTDALSDVANYKFLVGNSNLVMARKVVQLATQGVSIPGSFVKGYLPIIKMVHDIVRAGPAYINQLRVLHKRAQKTLKD